VKYETKSTFVVGYLFPFQSSPSPYVLSTSLLNNESVGMYKHSFLALSGIDVVFIMLVNIVLLLEPANAQFTLKKNTLLFSVMACNRGWQGCHFN